MELDYIADLWATEIFEKSFKASNLPYQKAQLD